MCTHPMLSGRMAHSACCYRPEKSPSQTAAAPMQQTLTYFLELQTYACIKYSSHNHQYGY